MVVDGMHAGQKPGGMVAFRCTSRFLGEDIDDTRSNCLPGAHLWVGSRQNLSVFGRPYHGSPQEGSCSLSMQLVSCIPWRSTDAVGDITDYKVFIVYESFQVYNLMIKANSVMC